MKKILITTNVLTLIILYFSSFKPSTESIQNNNTGPCDPICTNYSLNPIAGISNATANSMAKNYRGGQWKILNNNQSFTEARSVWFSLDKIKSFIGEMEALTNSATCTSKLDLGVRIYIGTYPDIQMLDKVGIKDKTAFKDVKDSYGKHLTLFMVPTYHGSDSTQIDFDPRNMGSNICLPTPLKDLLKIKTNPSASSSTLYSNAELLKFKKYGFSPSEINPPTTLPVTNKSISPAPTSSLTTPLKFSLILSGVERQEFFNPGKTIMKVTTVINHGNTIPPDPDNGSAF